MKYLKKSLISTGIMTDEYYFQGGFSNTGPLGAGSYLLGPPRTYGLEASITF